MLIFPGKARPRQHHPAPSSDVRKRLGRDSNSYPRPRMNQQPTVTQRPSTQILHPMFPFINAHSFKVFKVLFSV